MALIASSCTAPFMGAALGFALTASAPVALGVFVALGLGLALPYVVVTGVPAVAARLPKPGPWMVVARRLFAFPLYASVAWYLAKCRKRWRYAAGDTRLEIRDGAAGISLDRVARRSSPNSRPTAEELAPDVLVAALTH